MTSDPGPGSNGFPLPPATTPPASGGLPPTSVQPYGPPSYGPPSYGPPTPYGPTPYGPAPWGQAPYGQAPHGQAPYGQQPYPYPQPGQFAAPGMLAAAADRERVMDVVKAAFTEGRLTQTEFEERSARVLAARTYAELHALVADLPAGPGGPQLLPSPYPAGYYPQPLGPRTNGFAVGALVCGIVPFFGGIPAVILGHVGRSQIRRTGERGDGVAIAGLVLGYLWLTLWALIILVAMANGG